VTDVGNNGHRSLPLCGVPGCIALQAHPGFCAPHWKVVTAERPRYFGEPDLSGLPMDGRTIVTDIAPWAEQFVRAVYWVPLPIPCLLDYQFHSAVATVLIGKGYDANRLEMDHVILHLVSRLQHQVRRHRRIRRIGGCGRLKGARSDGRFLSQEVVAQSRTDFRDVTLPEVSRNTLVAQSGSCRRCSVPADSLRWVYAASPLSDWQQLRGVAGWMGICPWCGEQVSFFIDREN